MNPKVKAVEKRHLNTVLRKIRNAEKILKNKLENLGSSNLRFLQELREGSTDSYDEDFWIALNQLDEKNKAFNITGKYARLKEFGYLLDEPYFSRIDLFNEKGNKTKKIYIGKFGYSENKPIITDWRSKIASIYYRYRYPQKNVFYDAPAGRVNLDLVLKRTFEIEEGELIKYYNNDIQFDERDIIIKKIEGRTGGVLEDIIETIQTSQLDIIEADPRQVCIVQGCVGSGKSTVAIHKLAYIFFNHPEIIQAKRSILVAKNQILVGYLSTLFPKLGIFDINYKTLRDLIVNIISREELKINFDLDENQDTSGFSLADLELLNKSLSSVHKDTENKIYNTLTDPEFESYAGFKYDAKTTPYRNVIDLLEDINEELISQKNLYKENPKSASAWFYKENIRVINRLMKMLTKIRNDIKKACVPLILKEYGINIEGRLDYTQCLLYLYIYSEIIGFNNTQQYEYCVVDEGQDFSVLEYSLLQKLVFRNRFAIFGDLNQSLESYGINDWSNILRIIQTKTANTFKLDINYRSTKPIIELANTILRPHTKKYLPKSIERKGPEPKIVYLNSERELFDNFTHEIDKEIDDIDKTLGIICFNNKLFEKTDNYLKNKNIKGNQYIKLSQEQKIEYLPKGVYLMNFQDCKGLEFNKVFILGLNLDKIESFSYARRAFVAVTRAMNELTILGLS